MDNIKGLFQSSHKHKMTKDDQDKAGSKNDFILSSRMKYNGQERFGSNVANHTKNIVPADQNSRTRNGMKVTSKKREDGSRA
jgi:hypothetical protein